MLLDNQQLRTWSCREKFTLKCEVWRFSEFLFLLFESAVEFFQNDAELHIFVQLQVEVLPDRMNGEPVSHYFCQQTEVLLHFTCSAEAKDKKNRSVQDTKYRKTRVQLQYKVSLFKVKVRWPWGVTEQHLKKQKNNYIWPKRKWCFFLVCIYMYIYFL